MKGRTRTGRLRALDEYLLEHERALLALGSEAPIVDLGFGDDPVTTVELFEATKVPTIGIEADQTRAQRAAAQERLPNLRFIQGDFDRLSHLPKARIIRLMNVLRSGGVQQLDARVTDALIEGGLLIEGTSDPEGDLLTAHLYRRRGEELQREALLFHTTFRRGFAPIQFRDWLPRDLRRSVKPGQPIHDLFERWTEAWKRVRSEDPKASFQASVKLLGGDEAQAERGFYRASPIEPK